MATFIQTPGGWRAQVRRVGRKSISKTHPTKAEARAWARQIEADLDRGDYRPHSALTLATLIEEYRQLRETAGREIADTSSEHYVLRCLTDHLGHIEAESLEIAHLVEFAKTRRHQGAQPFTINIDISKLGTVLRHVAPILNLRLPDIVGQARPMLHHFGLIGGGGKRTRRPLEDELDRICAWLTAQTTSRTKPRMPDLIRLSALIGLRRAEGCRILWADLDREQRTILIRDRKDPRQKKGNHQLVPLIGHALDIIERQPQDSDRIFPLHPQTVSKAFTEACRALAIPDLHFHDLRHEAASALSEAGWSPHEIKAVTGHRKDEHLDRYINLDIAKIARKPLK